MKNYLPALICLFAQLYHTYGSNGKLRSYKKAISVSYL